MATVAINATDYFDAPATLHAQSSSQNRVETSVQTKDADGNVVCETGGLNSTNEFQTVYKYCPSTTADIKTDMGTLLTEFGAVRDSKIVTEITITYEPGDYATVTVNGVQFLEEAVTTINEADVSAAVPASSGFGVPTLAGVTLGDNASPNALEIRLGYNLVSAQGADGNHFATQAAGEFRADGSAGYVGVPTTLQPVTNFITDSFEVSDGNSDFDAAGWTGHRFFTMT
jgi:hypothetical protein